MWYLEKISYYLPFKMVSGKIEAPLIIQFDLKVI